MDYSKEQCRIHQGRYSLKRGILPVTLFIWEGGTVWKTQRWKIQNIGSSAAKFQSITNNWNMIIPKKTSKNHEKPYNYR